MAEIAIAAAIEVIKETIVIVGDLVKKEASHFSRLHKEIFCVETEMRRIQAYLKDAEHKQGESESVANLVKDIRYLAFDVEDVMEKYFPVLKSNKSKGFNNFLKCIPRIVSDCNYVHNFVTEIEAIKARVKDINRARQTYGIVEPTDQAGVVETNRWDQRRSFPHLYGPNIVGFEDHTEKLVAQVHDKDLELRVISIIGMGGLGKTTLAKKVYNSVRHSFNLTAWVYVSEKPAIRNIMLDIAKQVGLAKEKWEDGDIVELSTHLAQHRYVLVFDDIWRTNTWDALKIAIHADSRNGSRIVLTSQNRDVGVHVGGRSSTYQLRPLEDKYSKQVFDTVIGPRETTNELIQLEEIGEKILHRCGGVPLAIVVVAGLLKLREMSARSWAGVLDQMSKGQDEYSEIFSLSYRDLPIDVKPCFPYFGMFPEDHEIATFDLINLWAAEGFINGNEAREVEDVGYEYLNHLIARNLVHIGKVGSDGKIMTCRIHDILRTLCTRVAKEINFFKSCIDITHYDGLGVRRVTADSGGLRDLISSNYQNSRLRSLVFFDEEPLDFEAEEVVLDFLKDSNFLSVLHLNTYFSRTLCLKKVWGLRNLTHLKIDSRAGKTLIIPNTIINLERLVTLEIIDSVSVLHFPMVIWNMKRLRHLLLPYAIEIRCSFRRFNPKAISFHNFRTLSLQPVVFKDNWFNQLSNLRTLTFWETTEQIAELLLNSTLALDKLETLVLFASATISVRRLNLSRYHNLSSLDLDRVQIDQGPEPDELPPNLTRITLYKTLLKVDPLEILQKLPKLRTLILWRDSFSGSKMVCTGQPGNFPQLSEVSIYLKVNDELTIEEGGMPNLKEFKVYVFAKNIKLNVPSRIDKIKSVIRL